MKNIEKIKFICGLTLLSFAIIGGLIFFLESFKIIDTVLNVNGTSNIWSRGFVYAAEASRRNRDLASGGAGASNTPIFLGLCGLSGAYLLSKVRLVEQGEKQV